MNVTITRSKAKGKKYAAIFEGKGKGTKTVNFGAQGYQDFTTHHDPERKANYLSRHRGDPRSPTSAGELSRVILWSEPSLQGGIRQYEKKHGLKVRLRL